MGVSTTWTGASNSDWDTAGNWTNAVPVATGTAVIDGSVSITGGTPTAEVVDRVYVANSYTGAIGSVGTPLKLDVEQLSIDNTSSGSTHFIDLLGVTNTTPTVMVDGTKTGNALYLSGDLNLLIVESTFTGIMYLGNSASDPAEIKDLVMLTTTGTVDASTAANVAWVASSTIDVQSGTLNLGENVGQDSTMTVSGGTVNVSGWTTVTGDTLVMHGGTVNWNAGSTGLTPSSITTIRTIRMVGGTFTTAANDKAYIGLGEITQYGGTVNLQSSFANIDINTAYNSYAGTFTYPKQSVITTTAK
tara:strand:+ start:16862 stop:17770 length:909 start_codon:yes stop_codon:yes gene_type:complete